MLAAAMIAAGDGDIERVGVTYKGLPGDVGRGDTLLLDDGLLVLWVEEVAENEVHCRVMVGGRLSDSKGINRLGGGLSAESLTAKDREDIKFAAEIEADYVAVSFVMTADDVHDLKAWKVIQDAGMRGARLGGAQMSEKHSNFLINTGGATAADLEGLGEEVRKKVYDSSGITLEWEIMRVGEPAPSEAER